MKILVTGDGGMVYCRTPELSERLAKFLYLGLETESGLASGATERWWEFEVSHPGRRAIMNDITSAIGIEQLRKLPAFIERRKQISQYYNAQLASLDWLHLPPPIPADAKSSFYFYWIQTNPARRDRLAVHLRERGIYTTFRYYPLHRVPLYGARKVHLPGAEYAANSCLCIPIHQGLTQDDLDRVVESIRDFGRRL